MRGRLSKCFGFLLALQFIWAIPYLYLNCYKVTDILCNVFHGYTRDRFRIYEYEISLLANSICLAFLAVVASRVMRQLDIRAPSCEASKKHGVMCLIGVTFLAFIIVNVINQFVIATLNACFPASAHTYTDMNVKRMNMFHIQWIRILYVGIIVPIIEELYFRKLLMGVMYKIKIPLIIITLQALIFMQAHHYPINASVIVFISGFLNGAIFYYTGSFWYSVIPHSLTNILSLFAPDDPIKQMIAKVILFLGAIFVFFDSLIDWIDKHKTR